MPETPVDRLDAAIHAFWRELQERDEDDHGSLVTGWVVGFSTVRFQSENPDLTPEDPGMQYAIGPSTSLAAGTGIAHFLGIVHERAIWAMLRPDDEDD